jgi:ADP-heptose:LPS heptosyltransferase
VLHVGASSALKQWDAVRWMTLAMELERRGMAVVWSAGRGEERLVEACDPKGRFVSYAGLLNLSQLWHLVADASLLVAPDTGVSHLGRVTWTPTVTLFGPGSTIVCGPGRYWRDTPWRSVTVDPFPCRDQSTLFRSPVEWLRHCTRTTAECAAPRCMKAIAMDSVLDAVDGLSSPL